MKPVFLETLFDEMSADRRMAQILDIAYPRRIAAPNGYLNPKYYAIVTASSVFNSLHAKQEVDFVKSCIFFVSRKLTMRHVPTYFIGQEFAEAIAETDIEVDMQSSEIEWPDDAMLFAIPEKFSREFFGFYIPFIAMSHYSADDIKAMPGIRLIFEGPGKAEIHGQTFVHYQWYDKPEEPFMDYVTSWPDAFTLREVSERLGSRKMEVSAEEEKMISTGVVDHIGMTDEAKEKQLMEKIREFAVKLLLAMFEEPQFIEKGGIGRKLKVRNGKVLQTELWQPNMFGGNYKHPVADGHGTHASPKMHRRRGYRRNQRHGPGNTLIKKVRIWPCWVNAKIQ